MSEENKISAYLLIGGETPLRDVVHRFYEIMLERPEAKDLLSMHSDLTAAEEKLFFFLSGWLGGPNLYFEKYGHPKLRARHLPFKIGKPERDQWMLCMVQAFEETGIEDPARSEILHQILNLADHMRNQTDKIE